MNRPLLLPFVPLYAAGLALREMRLKRGWESVRRLRHPVVSVGNLSTGGSGKTPLTIALARLLTANGLRVDVLSRGYGRRSTIPMQVDPNGSYNDYGDEPLLIAREAGVPVFVASQRYDAGKLAENDSATAHGEDQVHILDDGFQHRQLARDVDILLVSQEDWQDHLLPAGNLRESLHAAMRASVIAIPANAAALESELRTWGWTGPVWRIRRRMQVPHLDGSVIAFCGIARPKQFLDGLHAAGLAIKDELLFADHHCYTARDVDRILSSARSARATAIVTTEKDRVRLNGLTSAFSSQIPLQTIGLATDIEDEVVAVNWLRTQLASHPSSVSL